MSESYLEIELDQQPIELCKLLKIADLVTGGGEAKVVISEGYVLLNGEVEYQKRKKIYHNDIVEFNGETIQVIIDENLTETLTSVPTENNAKEIKPASTAERNSKQAKNKVPNGDNSTKKAVPTNEGTVRRSKRRSISF